jgi:hypothetical protein
MAAEMVISEPTATDLDREKQDIHKTATAHVEDGEKPPINGIAKHLSQTRTPDEAKAEKRFVLKTDCIVLPLLASMYFLASLVGELSPPQKDQLTEF